MVISRAGYEQACRSAAVLALREPRPEERQLMNRRLYVGGLSWDTTESGLRQAFETCGSVQEAKLIVDRDTGRSRGFGFVTFTTEDEAQEAIRRMDGAHLDGRSLRVNVAQARGGPGRSR